jgi:hypothetical protein
MPIFFPFFTSDTAARAVLMSWKVFAIPLYTAAGRTIYRSGGQSYRASPLEPC